MTVPINFNVSGRPTDPARLGVDVVFDARIVEDVVMRDKSSRAYAAAMDYRSGQGSLISEHEEFDLVIVDVNAQIPALQEMISSLRDYQTATIDLTSYERIGKVVNFRLMDAQDLEISNVGCTHVRLSLECLVMP